VSNNKCDNAIAKNSQTAIIETVIKELNLMAEPTLTAVFGTNATQTADEFVISKADLVSVGLTPSANNSPESLLTAIVKRAEGTLTPANYDLNPDQSITIEAGFGDLPTRNGVTYRRNVRTISFYKVDTQADLDPDEY
jgi:hypothetical protein